MWADEINDPEYQDAHGDEMSITTKKTVKGLPDYSDLYYQPITSLHCPILNAITGEKTKYLIGSKDEKRFYCIMTHDPFDYKEACRLFFSSPQEYEKFSGVKVSDDSIRTFRENQLQFVNN
jgi:hypothetical protein